MLFFENTHTYFHPRCLNNMSFPDKDTILKALVGVTIEKVFLEVGGNKLLYTALSVLYQNYHAYLPDCYEHPEYLRKVFSELEGSSHMVVADAIIEKLEEYSYHKPIKDLLTKIKEIELKN